jgi:hypothetical protein
MKRAAYFWLSGAVLGAMTISTAWGQTRQDPLADYARQKRLEKQSEPAPKRVFDNDNLPREEHISVVGHTREEASSKNEGSDSATAGQDAVSADQSKDPGSAADKSRAEKSAADTSDEAKTKIAVTPGDSAEDRQKVSDEWKKKIADQKQTVDLESRELDVMQREYRLRAAAVYADAGNRLRSSATWDKEDKQYKDQIAAKQKAVDAAKQQLADLQEKARRAGVSSKDRETN